MFKTLLQIRFITLSNAMNVLIGIQMRFMIESCIQLNCCHQRDHVVLFTKIIRCPLNIISAMLQLFQLQSIFLFVYFHYFFFLSCLNLQNHGTRIIIPSRLQS